MDDEPETEDYIESSEEEIIEDSPEVDTPEIDSPEIDSPEVDSPEIDSPEENGGVGGCGEMQETLEQLKSLAGDMIDIITSLSKSEGRTTPIVDDYAEEDESSNEAEMDVFIQSLFNISLNIFS